MSIFCQINKKYKNLNVKVSTDKNISVIFFASPFMYFSAEKYGAGNIVGQVTGALGQSGHGGGQSSHGGSGQGMSNLFGQAAGALGLGGQSSGGTGYGAGQSSYGAGQSSYGGSDKGMSCELLLGWFVLPLFDILFWKLVMTLKY